MKFENVISLGYFCSTALEISRVGLRKASYPFDWLISSNFEKVIQLIDNNFEDFLSPEFFYQIKENPRYYRNKKLRMDFYHDFDELKAFDKQFGKVVEKYNRRIARFYQTIQTPTLFIRYLCSEQTRGGQILPF